MNGIVCLLKPTGLTSSDAVCAVRRALGTRAVGHLGTLDPFAAGVLPIAVGKATRLFDLFLSKTKTYRAIVRFGCRSTTLDTDAPDVTPCGRVPTEAEIVRVLDRFVGEYDQIPPLVSAKSVNGARAYDLARKGIDVKLTPKRVLVTELRLIDRPSHTDFTFDVSCGAGTYIRALFRDVAEALGTHAILSGLIRTRSGPWGLADTVTIEELTEKGENAIVDVREVLSELPRFDIPLTFKKKLDNGLAVPCDQHFDGPFTVYCDGRLYGLGALTDKGVRIASYLLDQE